MGGADRREPRGHSQLGLDLRRPEPSATKTWCSAPCNAEARRLLARPDLWPASALAVFGPARSGKTHLVSVWAETIGAVELSPALPFQERLRIVEKNPSWIDDADLGATDEKSLFHFLNTAAYHHQPLVLTMTQAPTDWGETLPDLKTRLQSLPVARLHALDDAVLEQVLERALSRLCIRPDKDLTRFILTRTERSVEAIETVTQLINTQALANHAAVTRTFAAKVLREHFGDEA